MPVPHHTDSPRTPSPKRSLLSSLKRAFLPKPRKSPAPDPDPLAFILGPAPPAPSSGPHKPFAIPPYTPPNLSRDPSTDDVPHADSPDTLVPPSIPPPRNPPSAPNRDVLHASRSIRMTPGAPEPPTPLPIQNLPTMPSVPPSPASEVRPALSFSR